MKIKIERTAKEILSLEGEWKRLVEQSKAKSIFLTWEWLNAWLLTCSKHIKPFIITVRNDMSELIGVFPLYEKKLYFLKLFPFKTLCYFGDYATGAEYPDVIAKEGLEDSVSDAIGDFLVSVRGWDCIWITKVSGWSGAESRIEKICKNRKMMFNKRNTVFSNFNMTNCKNQYWQSLSANRRSQLKRQTKKLWTIPGIEIIKCEDETELDDWLDNLFLLHHKRHMLHGDEGAFIRKPAMVTFYKEFAKSAIRNGWLWMFAIRVNREYKAIQIGYVYNQCFYQLQEGFDPNFLSGCGNVLRLHIIEQCIENNIQIYDFLGGYTEHKRRWQCVKQEGYDMFIGNDKLKSKLLFKANIWPSGKFFST